MSAVPGAVLREVQQRVLDVGFAVLPGAVPPERVRTALRLVGLTVRRCGLSAEDIARCQGSTFFPHLRWEPALWDLLPDGAAELLGWLPGDDWAEPQLLLRLPDEEEPWPLEPHLDDLPPWARAGQRYKGIVGIELTGAADGDGALAVWPGSHRGAGTGPQVVPLRAGDAVVLHPGLGHAGTLNRGAGTRVAVYFRLVEGGGRPDP